MDGGPWMAADYWRETRVSEIKRALRRKEVLALVGLSHTTIYNMERAGTFPRRFNLSPRCVAWDYQEVQQWLDARQRGESSTPAPQAA